MIKYFLIGLCLSYSSCLIGQIIYAPVFMDPCSQQEELVSWYVWRDSVAYYSEEETDFKSAVVPQEGIYKLSYDFSEKALSVHISQKDIHRDTFYLKQLKTTIYVSTPPFSEVFNCDSLAQGKITTYYYNGQKRVEGRFKDGQPIDTVFYYQKNGQHENISITKPKYWQQIKYYKDGVIQSDYHTKRRLYKTFYPNGQLQQVKRWGKGFHQKTYYADGTLQLKSNPRQLKQYSPQGMLQKQIKRKEILVLQRLFSKTPSDRHWQFYEYE
ncbi:MAG: hypothetical protein ACRBFS_16575 [Aureispira sp.]